MRLDGRVVMQRPAKPCTPVRFRVQPPIGGGEHASRVQSDRCSTARVVELVDTRDLKSLALIGVPVRFRLRAPFLVTSNNGQ